MWNVILLLSFLFCVSITTAQKKLFVEQKSHRLEKTINSHWTFNYFSSEVIDKGHESSGYNDSRWPAVSLPHSWNTYETTGEFYTGVSKSAEGDNPYWWMGWGWYRKHFSINDDFSDRKVFVEFEGVRSYCKVWLNGKYIGDHSGEDGSFNFDVTAFLKPGEDNLLAVAVNNKQSHENKLSSQDGVTSNKFGGICGDIKLVFTDKLFIPRKGFVDDKGGASVIASLVLEEEAVLTVNTWLKNEYPLKKSPVLQTTITDANNKIIKVIKTKAVIEPGQLFMFDQTIKSIKNPNIWSENNPYLYNIYSEIIDSKQVVDILKSSFGIKPGMDGVTSVSMEKPNVIIGLEEILTYKSNKNSDLSTQTNIEGEPAKILLTCPVHNIIADRGSAAVITADIVDSEGRHVAGANNTIKWNVSGEATLVGPDIYESDMLKHDQLEGGWYSEMPVSNLIRSTGKPGKIHITVSASGLASGSLEIIAEVIKQDNSVVIEPELMDEGREAVARIVLKAKRLNNVPLEIQLSDKEFQFASSDKQGYSKKIGEYILVNNPSVDPASVEFRTLSDLFGSHLFYNDGNLSADDYNFNVSHYNNCRLISGYINSTRLPQPFKDGLRQYYADAMILLGSEKDAGEEMNWLNWIPSGGTVVIFQDETEIPGKGERLTNKSELTEMISVVYPVFNSFSDVAKKRALIFISKMNPFIKASVIDGQSSPGDKEKLVNVFYTAEKGKPILIPDLKFISE